MARENYRNGDPVGLPSSGCDGCNPSMINGVLCREHGCPYAYKDVDRECAECGREFSLNSRFHLVCDRCSTLFLPRGAYSQAFKDDSLDD